MHKDARARKQLRRILLLLLTPFLCLAYLAYFSTILSKSVGVIGACIGFVMVGIISLYRSRRPAQDDGPLTLSLSAKPAIAEPPPLDLTPELRREFACLALLHAVLADRAGSESFVQTKILPEGVTVITRQRHLQVLRDYGLYDRLGDVERDLMLLPDGHWPQQTIEDVSMTLEPLRLLRWVLRADDFLPNVGSTLKADFRLAGSVVSDPEMVFKGESLIKIEDLRTAIEAAAQYFHRCWAEGVSRGFFSEENPLEAEAAREYADRLNGREGDDLLLGTTIVSLSTDAVVRLATTLGIRRFQILNWVRRRMYGEEPAKESYEAFYLR